MSEGAILDSAVPTTPLPGGPWVDPAVEPRAVQALRKKTEHDVRRKMKGGVLKLNARLAQQRRKRNGNVRCDLNRKVHFISHCHLLSARNEYNQGK